MYGATLGDLSQSYQLRQHNMALKQQMHRLTTELATGQVAEVRQVLAGNYSYLSDVEHKMDMLSGFSIATTEATHFAAGMQNALGHIEELGGTLSARLITAGTSAIGASGEDTVEEAKATLKAMISTINTDVAGRQLFAGTATDQEPLAEAETLLSELKLALSGATTPDAMLAAADIWFNDPAGFEALIYQGSNATLAPFQLSETDTASLDLRATDPALRETLKLVAMSTLADDPTLGLDLDGQSEMFSKTGQQMLTSRGNLIDLQAGVGSVEARIDRITARNTAERTGLEYAKAALLEVDPFDTATQLEEVQFQLQSLYSVTVRMSQLSLVNFL